MSLLSSTLVPASYLTPRCSRGISLPQLAAPAATRANPAKAGGTKPRVLASSATPEPRRHEGPHDRRATAPGSLAVVVYGGAPFLPHEEGLPMKNTNGMPMSVADFQAELAKAPEQWYAVSGDERLLARLPR